MHERKKNTKDELYSQTEIAKLLGVSGSTISRAIDDLDLTPAKIDGKRRLYTAGQVDKIKKARQQATTSTGKDSTKDQIEKLRQDYIEQLKAKDKQIDQLNEQLKMAQINLSQSQQLQLQQAEQIKRLELPEAKQADQGKDDKDQGTTSNENSKIKAAHVTSSEKESTKKHETLRRKVWDFLKG
ncbi:HTH domain-containing protein [Limosilactobacillus pontis]|uniref:HTH domain-containing protein n=1 Tax=Limosilactobacillus pontis TaxID=35787 RepID=UPI002F266130